jgi:prepilin-type N-terminal cleavage/methylation domain-containing protein
MRPPDKRILGKHYAAGAARARGFSLIELMIVVVVMMIVVGI